MKKLYTLSFILLASLSFAQFSEDFTGTGALNAAGWTTHSGTAGQLTISAGSLTYPGLTTTGNKIALVAGNGEDVNKSIGTAITTAAYYSTLVNFPNTTGLTTTGDYSLAFGGTTGASVTTLAGRLFFKTGAAANTFNIGIWNNSNATGGTGAATYVPTDYPIGTAIFVVVKYDRTTNSASLYVNPVIGDAEPVATLTNSSGTSTALAQIASVSIREAGNATAGTGNIEYDAIRVADNWAYVTSATLGLKQNAISGLNMYPNPVSNGNLYITSNSNSAKSITIFDVLGKQVIKTSSINNTVNVSSLKSGIYIVKITEEGKTAARKLIIE